MNYELAKQLKEAGFPQPDTLDVVCNDDYSKCAYAPTLSELIEACGDEFATLERKLDGWWAAFHLHDGTLKIFTPTSGKTPEEAVAKLYLALHENTVHNN